MGKEGESGTGPDNFRAIKNTNFAPPIFTELPGWPAILRVGEMADAGFLEGLESKAFDGYLVGVGAGTLLSLVKGFGKLKPKGILVVDVNPKVVAFTKVLSDALVAAQDTDEFVNGFFQQSEQAHEKKIKRALMANHNPQFQHQASLMSSMEQFHDSPAEIWGELKYVLRGDMIPVPAIIVDEFETLQGLARNNNIVSTYGDISDPDLVDVVRRLPGYETSTNVIYVSSAPSYSGKGQENFWKEVFRFGNPQSTTYIEAVSRGFELYLEEVNPVFLAASTE